MNKSNKQKIENPEIKREEYNKKSKDKMYKKSNLPYPDFNDLEDLCLYPGSFMGSTASSNECCGLMQTIPVTSAQLLAYDELLNYHAKINGCKNTDN